MVILFCNDCRKYLRETDCYSKEFEIEHGCYEDLVCCPHCDSTNIREMTEDEVIKELNR